MTPIAKILNKAADLIETKGWCQWNEALDKYGDSVAFDSKKAASFCMMGAIYRVSEEIIHVFPIIQTLSKSIRTNSTSIPESAHISDYNDAPRRTKKQVIAKLRKAAQKAEKEGI